MDPDRRAPWTLFEKVSFRFLASYVLLFFFPIPAGLSDPEVVSGIFDPLWHRAVTWFARHFLHLAITSFSNGSGDTTYDYVRVLCMLLLSAFVTAVWSILDRRRASYDVLHAWGRIWLRYAVACAMLTYGIPKLFHGQFYDPTYNVLTTKIGDMSPQRLLWTFIGISKGYEFFGGAGEVLGAALLLFRRTALLGALIVLAVMSNVVALNMAYDVCVKLGSSHLLFAAALLIVPDVRRLFAFFVLGRAVEPAAPAPVLPRPWMRKCVLCIQFALVVAFVICEVRPHLVRRPPLALFAVQTFSRDGNELADGDPERWTQFAFSTTRVLVKRGARRAYFEPSGDPKSGPVVLVALDAELHPIAGSAPSGEIHFASQTEDRAALEGTFNGHHVEATLTMLDRSKLRLLRTGFHWIHEEPDSEPR